MNQDELVLERIVEAFPDAVEKVDDFRGERTLYLKLEQVSSVCQLLRDDEALQFDLLTDICADDHLPDQPRFAVNYHLYSIPNNHHLRLRVRLDEPDEGPETVASIWPIATWLEMEVWDLMGIRFTGNESLRRLFMPEDWQGYPLRKDYPLGYEEVQFSFNWEEIDDRKFYAKD
jgi:NADH-quinone oxidoreductase subunit C